jgi:hypothetical protein
MDMAAAHLHVADGPYVVLDGQNQQPDSQKGDEEADRSEKQTAMRTVRYLLMDEMAELREMEQKQQNRSYDGGEYQEYPRSGDVHGSGLCVDAAFRGNALQYSC